MGKYTKVVTNLSIAIWLLMVIATAGGLLHKDIYQDNPFVRSVWRGNDVVTLSVAVPAFAAAVVLTKRGLQWAALLWLGMLDYALYNFAFYLFAAAFNGFFPVYVLLVALSIFALIFGLSGLDMRRIKASFRDRTPVRWIAGFMFFIAVGLTSIYLLQWLDFVVHGVIPEIIVKTGHPTNIVPALDLTLLIPYLVVGGIWLWQRRPWGYVLAAITMTKGTVYTLALGVAGWSAVQAGFPESAAELPLWFTLSGGSFLTCIILLMNLQTDDRKPGQEVRD